MPVRTGQGRVPAGSVIVRRVAGGVALVLLSFVAAAPTNAQSATARGRAVPSDVPEQMWIPNGPVEALAVSGRTLFVGGDFSDIVPDDSGGWFVAGAFRWVGGIECPRLAHIGRDGTLDEQWCPRPN